MSSVSISFLPNFGSGSPNPGDDVIKDAKRDYKTLLAALKDAKKQPNKDCLDKVLTPLKNLGLDWEKDKEKFLQYLGKEPDFQRGDRSYDSAIRSLSENIADFPSDYRNLKFDAEDEVRHVFAPKGEPGTKIRVGSGIVLTSYQRSKDHLRTYFGANAVSSPSLIFHEALHGYGASINNGKPGNFSDEGLYTAFGITDPNRGSSDITKHIEKYCANYFK